jgi:hypothetical protein
MTQIFTAVQSSASRGCIAVALSDRRRKPDLLDTHVFVDRVSSASGALLLADGTYATLPGLHEDRSGLAI